MIDEEGEVEEKEVDVFSVDLRDSGLSRASLKSFRPTPSPFSPTLSGKPRRKAP